MAVNEHQLNSGTNQAHSNADDEDPDAVLALLEEEDDSAYRAQRLQELRSTASTAVSNAPRKSYLTLKGDDDTLAFTTENERAVVHFFHPDFARCSTMDGHCEAIAQAHADFADGDVAFAKVDVNHAPFVVEKLAVRVLPCVIGFVKGVVKGRITGFEGLCWNGKEGSRDVTQTLETAFIDWTVLRKRLIFDHDHEDSDADEDAPHRRKAARGSIRDRQQTADDEDDDWD